jgi:branched-chain amino acid transport system permease protein
MTGSPTSAGRVILGLAVPCIVGLPLTLQPYYISVATQILIFALLAMSVDILAGYTGRTPLCHGAIFGASTYVTIYTASILAYPLAASLALGVLAATAIAALFGLLAVRTSGVYFLLLTLALGLIVWGICLRWTQVTGGENGIRGQLRSGMLAGAIPLYLIVAGVAAILCFAMWRFVNSPFGLTLRGIMDSESRMASLGYSVPVHLTVAFTVSGFVAGIAGALYAIFNDFVSPSTVQLSQSVEALLMAIAGGIGTLIGSFAGAFLIIALQQAVSAFTERWLMVLGFTFILIMIFAPEGIVGKARLLLARRYAARPQQGKGNAGKTLE